MADVDIGFVGWPGGLDDDVVHGIRAVAHDLGRLVVVTFGAHGVRVFDGRPDGDGDRFVPVEAVPVRGTTLGCGDAFIAGFLEAWRVAAGRGDGHRTGQGPGRGGHGLATSPPRRGLRPRGRAALRATDRAAAAQAGEASPDGE